VTPKDVRGFVTWLTSNHPTMSRGTIERHIATIKAMYGDAVADNEIPFNPAREVRVAVGRKLLEPVERRVLSRDEIRSLMAAVPEDWKLMVEFTPHTGMRLGEVVELRWGDIEFAKRTIVKVRRSHVEGAVNAPKGGSEKVVVDSPWVSIVITCPAPGGSQRMIRRSSSIQRHASGASRKVSRPRSWSGTERNRRAADLASRRNGMPQMGAPSRTLGAFKSLTARPCSERSAPRPRRQRARTSQLGRRRTLEPPRRSDGRRRSSGKP
jgi:integrase-like protein